MREIDKRIFRKSEAFLQNPYNVFRFSHRVEMHCRYSMGEQVPALHYAPLRADFIDGSFVVSCLSYRFSKSDRDVQ